MLPLYQHQGRYRHVAIISKVTDLIWPGVQKLAGTRPVIFCTEYHEDVFAEQARTKG